MGQYSKEDIGGGIVAHDDRGIARLADGANKDIAVTNATASGSAIEEHTHHWTYSGNGYSNMMACRCDSAVGTCPVEDRMARRLPESRWMPESIGDG